MQTDLLSTPGKTTRRLLLQFLLPLLVVNVAVVLVFVSSLNQRRQQEADHDLANFRTIMGTTLAENIAQEARLLGALANAIQHDQEMRDAFVRHNRAALQKHSTRLFADLKARHGVQFLHLTDPELVTVFRGHQPELYGDIIYRHTNLVAARTGQPAFGAEIGTMGEFSLRYVTPWPDTDGRLLGYLELGSEMGNLLDSMQHRLNVPLYVFINKQFLGRELWEASMRELGRSPQWDRFKHMVLAFPDKVDLPAELNSRLSAIHEWEKSDEITMNSATYRIVPLPLQDAGGRTVGTIIALQDITLHNALAQRTMWVGSLATLLMSGLLMGFFYWRVKKIAAELEHKEQVLLQLASHDGLTGLLNHKSFYTLLIEEVERAQRYHTPLSLLLLDLDRFKKINDKYGHLAGDKVLKEVSTLLLHYARTVDKVCRYGGEEIAVILPGIDLAEALQVAERLRAILQKHRITLPDGQDIGVTASIGVATLVDAIKSAQDLTDAADRALYNAKHTGRNRVSHLPQNIQ
ncbi:MAG: diguanylate cyclase [Pseudomonadota bacterium]